MQIQVDRRSKKRPGMGDSHGWSVQDNGETLIRGWTAGERAKAVSAAEAARAKLEAARRGIRKLDTRITTGRGHWGLPERIG
jgi:hypothetical protein